MKTIKNLFKGNGNYKSLILMISILIVMTYSCEKESDNIEAKFKIKYQMVNLGDASLDAAVIYCTTVFPEENLTSWLSKGKWRNANWYQPELLLHNYDSLIAIPDILGYPGCFYQYWVCLHFYDSLGNPYRRTYFKSDTIENITNSFITFYWPSDSSNFEQQY